MDKIHLITLVVKQKVDGLYEHTITPGGKMGDHYSQSSGGYVAGALNTIDAIRFYVPHVACIVVTPWDGDAGTCEISFSISTPTGNLLKSKGLFLAPEDFYEQEWDDRYDFFKIVPESEIASHLDSIQALVQHWNDHLD